MPPIHPSLITILAIGVENYASMPRLQGPKQDVEQIYDEFVQNPSTALFSKEQFIKIVDPDSKTLRDVINNYVSNKAASGDVLIFYFSGHGAAIGRDDFGICTVDSKNHEETGAILPFSVLRFSDLVATLQMVQVTPIFIIDACYSGVIGRNLTKKKKKRDFITIPTNDAISILKNEVTSESGEQYALLCSCSDAQYSYGNENGGYFTQALIKTLTEGYKTKDPKKSIIYIEDIFPDISTRLNSFASGATAQLFLGKLLPQIPFIKNIGFVPKSYRFSRYMKMIVLALWNGGNEIELSRDEILTQVGRGAYGNHSKLSYKGWDLIEDNPKSKKRRLTEKGRKFAVGELGIPDTIIYDSSLDDYLSPENPQIKVISDY
jgi:hypothetical protein